MRLVFVSHAWDEGGSALYARTLAEALEARGHPVARLGPGAARRLSPVDPVSEAALAAVLPADVVHIHHLSGSSWRIPRLAREAGAKVVYTLHDAFGPCARGQLVDLELQRCEGPELARCARCLAPDQWAPLPAALARSLPPRSAPLRERFAAWDEVRRQVDLVLTPSPAFARRLGLAAVHLPLPLLHPVRPSPPSEGPVRLLFVGSMIPTKGPDLALEAFARLPAGAASLRLVGPAPAWRGSHAWAEALRARAAQVPGARLEGPTADIASVYAEADVLLLPSTWEENAPLVLLEARAAGLRIVASDLACVDELAPHASRVAPEVEAWRRALAAQVRLGRRHLDPIPAPGVAEHAEALLDLYARLVRGGLP